VIGVYDFEFANPKATRVFVVTLRADLPSPFAPQSDESGEKKPETPTPPKEDAKAEAKTEEREVPKDFRIDLAGIGENGEETGGGRVTQLFPPDDRRMPGDGGGLRC